MRNDWVGRAVWPAPIACVLFVVSCKTDAQRADDERAQIESAAQSIVVAPYRSLKVVARASALPKESRPAAFDDVTAAYARVANPPTTIAQSEDEAKAYAALAIALERSHAALKSVDEDSLPLLWSAFHVETAAPDFYDNGLEHLGLATMLLLFDAADPNRHTPAVDVEWYELSRAQPSFRWPWSLRTWTRGAKGVAYALGGFRFAAEEELSAFLVELASPGDQSPVVLGSLHATAEQALEAMRAAGHLARAWNRIRLGRRGPADDDVNAALLDLDKLGVGGEIKDRDPLSIARALIARRGGVAALIGTLAGHDGAARVQRLLSYARRDKVDASSSGIDKNGE